MKKKLLKSLLEAEVIFSFNSKKDKIEGVQVLGANEAVIVRGGQLGLKNIARDVKGFQISLLSNHSDTLYGVQAGLLNWTCLKKGVQAGLINCALDYLDNKEQEWVVQAGGLNITNNASTLYQLGYVNYASANEGLQIGLINAIGENGYQMGLLNMSKRKTAQVGAINISQKGDENQSGLINIIFDTEKAWQFGVLNIIRNNPWYMKILPAVNYSVPKEFRVKKRKQKLKNEIEWIKKTAEEEGNNGIVYARF